MGPVLKQSDRRPDYYDTALLTHWLRVHAIDGLDDDMHLELCDAVIIGIDAEWYEHDSDYITELGITIIDPRNIPEHLWPNPWKVVDGMIAAHFRIKENAHMINGDLCPGRPDQFQFGTTKFLALKEASDMLADVLNRHDEGEPRLILLLGHDVGNDVRMLEKHFNVDWDATGEVLLIDTQNIAVDTGYASPGERIGLSRLIGKFGIEEEYLHNAGNDIVCTSMAALGMIGNHVIDDPDNAGKAYYKDLRVYLKSTPDWLLGDTRKHMVTPSSLLKSRTKKWCTNCEVGRHDNSQCRERYKCKTCGEKTHTTKKCLIPIKKAALSKDIGSEEDATPFVPRFPIPCESCIMSTDSKRNAMDLAYAHLEKDCPYEFGKVIAA